MLVENGETVENGELAEDGQERSMAPELLCLRAMSRRPRGNDSSYADARENARKAYEFLRMVRLAGGWRSYVAEERRGLATLMALWKRQRRATAGYWRHLRRSAAPKFPRRGRSAPPPFQRGSPGDIAVLSRVFELPLDLAGRILSFYTDLVL